MTRLHQGWIIVCAALLAGAGASAQTQYYQCKDRWGQAVFSDKPCGADAREGAIGRANSSTQNATDQGPAPVNTAKDPDRAWQRVSASNRLREIARETSRREQRVAKYQAERDQKVGELQEQRKLAANNLAGATWEKSLASEMRAVVSQYNAKITSEQTKIDRLDREAQRLQDDL